jgi:hypothetical protein
MSRAILALLAAMPWCAAVTLVAPTKLHFGVKEGTLQALSERVASLEQRPRFKQAPALFQMKQIHDRLESLAKKIDERTAARKLPNKFVTFDWNSGRMGNQFESLRNVAAIAHMTGRTLLLKRLTGKSSKGSAFHQNGRIGFDVNGNGLWDTDYFKENFNVLFQEDVETELGSIEAHPILGDRTKWCLGSDIHIHKWSTVAQVMAASAQPGCAVMDFCGWSGVMTFSGRYDDPFIFWKAIRPIKKVRDAVKAFWEAHEWAQPSFAFHLRNHAPGEQC